MQLPVLGAVSRDWIEGGLRVRRYFGLGFKEAKPKKIDETPLLETGLRAVPSVRANKSTCPT